MRDRGFMCVYVIALGVLVCVFCDALYGDAGEHVWEQAFANALACRDLARSGEPQIGSQECMQMQHAAGDVDARLGGCYTGHKSTIVRRMFGSTGATPASCKEAAIALALVSGGTWNAQELESAFVDAAIGAAGRVDAVIAARRAQKITDVCV
jgi:hypothetical protein